jgi:hypothetical protein
MPTPPAEIRRAADNAAIAPLIALCKAGRLFDVQRWIAEGKPVNTPPIPSKGARTKSPLDVAIERGFHTLVQVLLEGGAIQEPSGYDSPMNRTLRARRFDIVKLLVKHGFDPKSVDMNEVFASWDPDIMEYFIERGADVQRGNPFAGAFCERIRTALRPYKACCQRMPELQEQANIALRHHCKEGNVKWVSLMLWAGADPFKPGAESAGEELDAEDEGLSALGYAALYDHFEIFELKPIRSKLGTGEGKDFIRYLDKGSGLEVLKRLLEKGLNPSDEANGGCSLIGHCLESMSWWWSSSAYPWERDTNKRNLDTPQARDRIKAIHLLAKHGAKWMPADNKRDIASARRSLLRMKPD